MKVMKDEYESSKLKEELYNGCGYNKNLSCTNKIMDFVVKIRKKGLWNCNIELKRGCELF